MNPFGERQQFIQLTIKYEFIVKPQIKPRLGVRKNEMS